MSLSCNVCTTCRVIVCVYSIFVIFTGVSCVQYVYDIHRVLCVDYVYNICRGFVKYSRATNQYRLTEDRLNDWGEVYNHKGVMEGLRKQAARYTASMWSLWLKQNKCRHFY